MAEMARLLSARAHHRKVIKELEKKTKLSVSVTTHVTKTTMHLSSNERCQMKHLRDSQLMWSPDAAGVGLKVITGRVKRKTIETKESVSAWEKVRGKFVREWGEKGDGPGQLCCPAGVAIQGEEVFVCDAGNDRICVFKRDL